MSQEGPQAEERRREQLAAEARYAHDRYRLYRAKAYGPRPVSQARLMKLQRASDLAEARWSLARSTSSPAGEARAGDVTAGK